MKKFFSYCQNKDRQIDQLQAELVPAYLLTHENLHPKKINIFDPWPNSPVTNFTFVTFLHSLFAGSSLIFGSFIHAQLTPNDVIDPTVIGAAFAGAAMVSVGVRLMLLALRHILKVAIAKIAAFHGLIGTEQEQLARQKKIRPHFLHTAPLLIALVFGLKVSGGLLHMTATHEWPISLWSGILGVLAATLATVTSVVAAMYFSKEVREYVEEFIPEWRYSNGDIDTDVTPSDDGQEDVDVESDMPTANAQLTNGVVSSSLANFVAANGVAGQKVSADDLGYDVDSNNGDDFAIVHKPGESDEYFTTVSLSGLPS